jgi:hypothetical protein
METPIPMMVPIHKATSNQPEFMELGIFSPLLGPGCEHNPKRKKNPSS